jgi:hypothetical protein
MVKDITYTGMCPRHYRRDFGEPKQGSPRAQRRRAQTASSANLLKVVGQGLNLMI